MPINLKMTGNKINVLQINKLYYPYIGGVESIVKDIAEGLKDKVNMDVLVCKPSGRKQVDNINGIKVVRAGSIGIWFSLPISFTFSFELRKLSRDKDILHFHMPFPLGDLSYLLMKPKGKVVIWWHSDIIRQKMFLRFYAPFMKRFLKRADKIIVASPRHIEGSQYLKEVADKCEVIPFGIDVNKYRLNKTIKHEVKRIRDKYGPNIALFTGRLIYYKGIEYLVNAMKDVDCTLLIAGEGYLESKLKNMVVALGIEHKVFFLGRIEEALLSAYFNACDIFVFPSVANSEAFGIVQIEAMACGKPVINTSLPTAVPWVSINGETGITVSPKDSTALADAMNLLLENRELREQYGRNALERVKANFSVTVMMEKILKMYTQLLSE